MKRFMRLLSVTLALVILAGALPVAAKSKLAKPKAPLSALAGTNVIVGYAEPSAVIYITYADQKYEGKADKNGLYKIIINGKLKKDTSFTIWQKKNKVTSKKAAYVVDTPDKTNGLTDDTQAILYSDYDNTTIKGSDVKQLINESMGKDFAILVNNTAFNGIATTGSCNPIKTSLDAIDPNNWNKTTVTTIETSGDGGAHSSGQVQGYTTTGNECFAVWFVNYNAVLGEKNVMGKNVITKKLKLTDLYKDTKNGYYVFLNDFATDDNGKIQHFTDTIALDKRGDAQYIANSAEYKSALIRNPSNEIIGVVFIQVPTT